MVTAKSLSWLEIESFYRGKAKEWDDKGAFYDGLAKELTADKNAVKSDNTVLRKLQVLTRASGKCAVQAVKFYELADNAKDLAWQDVYGDKIDLIEKES